MNPQTPAITKENVLNQDRSYVDWSAIIAGIVFASGISIIFLTFGSAIGLSFVRMTSGTSVSIAGVIAAVIYLLWVQISSFMAGAYLTGRMRHRFHDATEHESDIRDGAHGLIMWSGAIILGAYLATTGFGATLNAVGTVAKDAVQVAAPNPNAYFSDMLLRSDANVAPQQRTDEVGRILAKTATGKISKSDQDYLVQVVAKQAGLSPADATTRVNDVLTQVDTAKAEAAKVAEQVRKTAILSAFIAAASLLVSAAASYWAACMGGNHRDEGVVFEQWIGQRRNRPNTK